jgi:ABC-type microcin C transport system permease subunit YejB
VQEKDSWLPPKDLDAQETNFYFQDISNKYAVCFYYAMLLVVGNEAAPTNNNQMIYASMIILIGYIVTAFIFGNMAALMANLNRKDSQFQEIIDFVSSTMRSIKLPENMQDDVLKYL